jgi:DNA-binding PadR family transcriptional regulator
MLALAVLAFLTERPMHPYEIAKLLRERGKDLSIKINYGSLYTVVQNLEKDGLIEAVGIERDGRRPERTTYGVTPAGREQMHDQLSEFLAVRVNEYPRFESALSLMGVLPPDEVRQLLATRLASLDAGVTRSRKDIRELTQLLPRIFVLETEYALAMLIAEADWVRGLLVEMDEGTLDGLDGWRHFHSTGHVPEDFDSLPDRVREHLAQLADDARSAGEKKETTAATTGRETGPVDVVHPELGVELGAPDPGARAGRRSADRTPDKASERT